jgi:hypothetical protein
MKIRLHRHIFSGAAPEEFEADSLAQWLLDRYERGPRVGFQVFAGEPSAETDITSDEAAILRGDAPIYTVLLSPGYGTGIGDALIAAAISMTVSAAVSFLFAKDPTTLDNRSQESPNNQLSNRENRVRALERVEDIYGTVRSIPTMMMPTYFKYIDHKKVEYGYYCIGRGYYDVDDVRDGDTLLSDITGASAAVYAPFTSPNNDSPQLQIGDAIIDEILTVTRSSSVDAITLKAQNQIQLKAASEYYFRGPSVLTTAPVPIATAVDILYQPLADRKPNFAAVCEIGQVLTISMSDTSVTRDHTTGGLVDVDAGSNTYTSTIPGFFRGVVNGYTINVSGSFSNSANIGVKTVLSHTDQTLTVAETLVTEASIGTAAFDLVISYAGTRTIATVESGYVTLTSTALYYSIPESIVATITVANGLADWTDWYTLPDLARTEVWTNVIAQNGIYKDDGAKSSATVAYEVQIEALDGLLAPTGIVETVTGSLSGATSSERAETLERVTGWLGASRVRARRTTAFDYDFTGLVIDEIRWMDLYSVVPVDKAHFGNKTTIHTVTRTTAGSTAVRRRELNCLASRLLPTFNGTVYSATFDEDGLLFGGTLNPTSKIFDIISAVAIDPKIGALSLDDLDLTQMWAVQQALDAWNTECGQFNYTFDSDSLSFEETVHAIANAGFCVPYRQNGQIRLALDRPQSASVALFTHRNKKPDSETITRTFSTQSEYDGIELAYRDPETEDQETIRLPLDGSFTKLKKVEITGIRSYEQAWFRANREYNRLRSQRMTIDTVTTTDARALLPNSRVDIVDNTRFKSFAGEVVGQSGLTLTLSCDVEFLPSTAHSVVLMKRDGSIQSLACTEVAGETNKVLLASTPAETIITTPTAEDGIRTIFSFAADSARAAQAWLVQELEITDDGYVRIRGINYSDDYYTADEEAVPAKDGVIN